MELLFYPLAGLLTGLLIGLTGVGAGGLMTPLPIFAFGATPHARQRHKPLVEKSRAQFRRSIEVRRVQLGELCEVSVSLPIGIAEQRATRRASTRKGN